MKHFKILYMGTPEFSVEGITHLLQSSHQIIGVVTTPDRAIGRGQKLSSSPVKQIALKHNIPVLQPSNLKSDTFISQVKMLCPDLIIVVAFRMLPKVLWEIPKYGTFNLHASLLPNYRGAAPINWVIINGENQTGLTTFFIDKHIDTGAIILQKTELIHSDDTAETLHNKLMRKGGKLILETTNIIAEGKVFPKKQPKKGDYKLAPKIFKSIQEIHWKNTPTNIYNFVRGLSPYPTAWSKIQNGLNEFVIKIYEVTPEEKTHDLQIGRCYTVEKSVKVAVKGGFIILKKVQLPNRKPMPIRDLLNGFSFDKNARFL